MKLLELARFRGSRLRKVFDGRRERKQLIEDILLAIVLCAVAGVLFYRSLLGILFLLPYTFLFVKKKKKQHMAEREWLLTDHFCEAIKSISAALEAGYSVENSLKVAATDLISLYSEEDELVRELGYMYRQIQNSVSAERAFAELAERIEVEDVRSFADIFATVKRTGGDVIRIIDQTASVIVMKHEVRREVRTLTAAKQFEAGIMKLMPFGILAYLNLFSPGMISSVYEGAGGRVFMTVMLALYVFAAWLADRLVDIRM